MSSSKQLTYLKVKLMMREEKKKAINVLKYGCMLDRKAKYCTKV